MRVVWLIFKKDVVTELRTRALAGSMLVFALVVVVVLSLVTERAGWAADPAQARQSAAAVLWLSLLFAGVLGLARNFAQEAEMGAWRGLLLSPAPREALYLGKVASGTLFVLVVEVVVFPPFLVLYGPVAAGVSAVSLVAVLVPTAVLAAVGLAAVGVLFTALTAGTGGREALLAGLVLPVVSPVLLAAVWLTSEACGGAVWGPGLWRWWALVAGFDLMILALGSVLFEYVVEE